jgi:hypothetical protein
MKNIQILNKPRFLLGFLNGINFCIWIYVFYSVMGYVALTHPAKQFNIPKLISALSLSASAGYVCTMPLRRKKDSIRCITSKGIDELASNPYQQYRTEEQEMSRGT